MSDPIGFTQEEIRQIVLDAFNEGVTNVAINDLPDWYDHDPDAAAYADNVAVRLFEEKDG